MAHAVAHKRPRQWATQEKGALETTRLVAVLDRVRASAGEVMVNICDQVTLHDLCCMKAVQYTLHTAAARCTSGWGSW